MARREDVRKRLAASRNPEHIYSAVLLETDATLRAQRMSEVLLADTSNVLLAWHGLDICSQYEGPDGCPLERLERRLLDLDSQNAMAWARVAVNRMQRGETDSALDAMRYAASAAEARSYWPETVEMLERAMAANSDLAFQERAGLAIAGAAAILSKLSPIVTICREQPADSPEWARACLDYGSLLERRQETEIGKVIGLAIQQATLETLGMDLQRDEVAAKVKTARRDRNSLWSDRRGPLVDVVLLTSPRDFAAYLNAVRQHGEYKAREALHKEVTARLAESAAIECAE